MASANQIDVCLFADKTRFLRLKILRLRAVYITVDGEIVVRCDGNFRKIYLMPDGLFACFATDAVFPAKSCRRVKVDEIGSGDVNLEEQSTHLFSLHGKRGTAKAYVTQNSLGTYLYFSGSETQFTDLLVDLHEAKIPRVVSWEDGCFEDILLNAKFHWRAKFATGVSKYSLYKKISDILKYLPDNGDIGEEGTLLDFNSPTPTAEKAVVSEKSERAEPNVSALVEDRVSKAEKFMRESMFHLLPNLAIHPDIIRLMSKNLDSVGPLLNVLQRIDVGDQIHFKKIAASAGSSGWREVNDHISNGRNKSLRVYYRKNNNSMHRLDVFVENKTNKNSQNKTFDRLAKMKFFENRDVIFQ